MKAHDVHTRPDKAVSNGSPPMRQRSGERDRPCINDSLEHEADFVADEVIATSAPKISQTKPARSSEPSTEREISQRVNLARENGSPVEPTVLAHMEARFGRSFADVRVHADAQAGYLTRQLGARAFTTGNDIFFDQPSSLSNRRLMAHELTHVAQQGSGRTSHRHRPTSEHIVIQRETKRPAISAGKPGSRPNLDVGDVGPGVSLLQSVLGIPSTGVFDETTRKAVVAFQRARPTLHPATGGVGPKTWDALDEIAKNSAIPGGAAGGRPNRDVSDIGPVAAADPNGADVVTLKPVTVEGRSQDQIAKDIQSKTGMRAYDIAKLSGVTPSTVPASTWAGDTEASLEDAGVIPSQAGTPPAAAAPPSGPSAVPLSEPYDRRRRYIRRPVDDVLQYELEEFYGTAEEAEEEQNRINMKEGSDRAGAALAAGAGGGKGTASRGSTASAPTYSTGPVGGGAYKPQPAAFGGLNVPSRGYTVTGDQAAGRVQTRVNIASGKTATTPTRGSGAAGSAGWDHVRADHFGRGVANNRSTFTASEQEVKAILQSDTVVRAQVTKIDDSQFLRVVDTGRVIGRASLSDGGMTTTWIRVITDRAGNLITTYPVAPQVVLR